MREELLTIDSAAQMLQIEPATVRRWLERGLRHDVEPDGDIRIRRDDLDAFLAQEGQGQARDAATET